MHTAPTPVPTFSSSHNIKKKKKKKYTNSGFFLNSQRHSRFWTRQIGRGVTLHIITFWHCALCLHDRQLDQILLPEGLSRGPGHARVISACLWERGAHLLRWSGLVKWSHPSLRSRYPSSTGERSWSAGVWTCIPGPRTVAPLWGRTASPWQPRPASPHPPPGLGLRRRRARTVWRGGTRGAGRARRSRSSGRTSGHSEQSHLERRISVCVGGGRKTKISKHKQQVLLWRWGKTGSAPWDSIVSALSRCSRSSMPMSSRFWPECQKSRATSLIVAPPMLLSRQRAHRTTCQLLMLYIAGCISCQILAGQNQPGSFMTSVTFSTKRGQPVHWISKCHEIYAVRGEVYFAWF